MKVAIVGEQEALANGPPLGVVFKVHLLCIGQAQPLSRVELFLEGLARRARRPGLVPLHDTWQRGNVSINKITSSI